MSLKRAVLEATSKLTDALKLYNDGNSTTVQFERAVSDAVAELRGAANATPDEQPRSHHQINASAYEQLHHDGADHAATQRIKEEIALQKQKADFQEAESSFHAECVTGPCKGDLVPCDGNMPAGAYCVIGGHRYKLSDDRSALLHAPTT